MVLMDSQAVMESMGLTVAMVWMVVMEHQELPDPRDLKVRCSDSLCHSHSGTKL